MLNEGLFFNYRSIRSFTTYACEVDEDTVEREISFSVIVGPSVERKGDVFPVYRVPPGKMIWLSDWSFNTGGPLNRETSIGGSLGRITADGRYVYVLNCAVDMGEMEIFSPSRSIRYITGEWFAVCFHHHGAPNDVSCRATFRFTEVTASTAELRTEYFNWGARDRDDRFPGPG